MQTAFFIAKRIIQGEGNTSTNRIIRFALIGIALSLAIMILSVAIITGFKKAVKEKVSGFGGHIQITNFDSNISFETTPVSINPSFLPQIAELNGIKTIQPFALKGGIMRTKSEMQGVLLKGVDGVYNWDFFRNNLVSGTLPDYTSGTRSLEILISNTIGKKLGLGVNDTITVYFIQNPPRVRKFAIVGVFDTGLKEYDELMVIADIRQVQRLNEWDEAQVSGFELFINDFDQLTAMTDSVYFSVNNNFQQNAQKYMVKNIQEIVPQIFDWLRLSDINVWVILSIMSLVAGFNVITALLILIIERTRMIGILKAMGSRDKLIRQIFIMKAMYLLGKGLFWGNIFGISLALFQQFTHFFTLDAEAYYVNYVPIHLDIVHVLLINAGTILIVFTMLLIPSWAVSRISPVKAIRFQ